MRLEDLLTKFAKKILLEIEASQDMGDIPDSLWDRVSDGLLTFSRVYLRFIFDSD